MVVSRVVWRLVSRAIHSYPTSPSIFRHLECLPSFPNSNISRWVHSSVPIDADPKAEDLPPPPGKMGDFRYYPADYLFGYVVTPIHEADDTTSSEQGNVPPRPTAYRLVASIVPPDHPGVVLARKQPKLKRKKGERSSDPGWFQDLKGPFKYDDSELVSSEEGLWELYRRWQLHFFGEYDIKEKRNSRTFKKFKKSAQYAYDQNKSSGFKTQAPLGQLSATCTPQELDKQLFGRNRTFMFFD